MIYSRLCFQIINSFAASGNYCYSFQQITSKDKYVPKALQDCCHVWLRVDCTKRPLEAPYSDLYPVLERDSRTMLIQQANNPARVSLDRVKPCYLPKNSFVPKPYESIPTEDDGSFCLCRGPFHTDMIGCDASECPIE